MISLESLTEHEVEVLKFFMKRNLTDPQTWGEQVSEFITHFCGKYPEYSYQGKESILDIFDSLRRKGLLEDHKLFRGRYIPTPLADAYEEQGLLD